MTLSAFCSQQRANIRKAFKSEEGKVGSLNKEGLFPSHNKESGGRGCRRWFGSSATSGPISLWFLGLSPPGSGDSFAGAANTVTLQAAKGQGWSCLFCPFYQESSLTGQPTPHAQCRESGKGGTRLGLDAESTSTYTTSLEERQISRLPYTCAFRDPNNTGFEEFS